MAKQNLTSKDSSHDWRNPRWLEEGSECGNWWDDWEAPPKSSPKRAGKAKPRPREDKERELNELIAKGLQKLDELRRPRCSVTSAPKSPQAATPKRPSTKDSSPVPPLRLPRAPPLPKPPRPASRAAREPSARSSSLPPAPPRSTGPHSPTTQFAFFHGSPLQQLAQSARVSLSPRVIPWRHAGGSTLPPRPALRESSPEPSTKTTRKITPKQFTEFYEKEMNLMKSKLERSLPREEPEHKPEITSYNTSLVYNDAEDGKKLDRNVMLYNLHKKRLGKEKETSARVTSRDAEDEKECTFKPQIGSQPASSSYADESVKRNRSIFNRLYKMKQQVDEKELYKCDEQLFPFKPKINGPIDGGGQVQSDMTQEEKMERLSKEGEGWKKRRQEELTKRIEEEQKRLEIERRKANHHYEARQKRLEEQKKRGNAVLKEMMTTKLAHSGSPSHGAFGSSPHFLGGSARPDGTMPPWNLLDTVGTDGGQLTTKTDIRLPFARFNGDIRGMPEDDEEEEDEEQAPQQEAHIGVQSLGQNLSVSSDSSATNSPTPDHRRPVVAAVAKEQAPPYHAQDDDDTEEESPDEDGSDVLVRRGGAPAPAPSRPLFSDH